MVWPYWGLVTLWDARTGAPEMEACAWRSRARARLWSPRVGEIVGLIVGMSVRLTVGLTVGAIVGLVVGLTVGLTVVV